ATKHSRCGDALRASPRRHELLVDEASDYSMMLRAKMKLPTILLLGVLPLACYSAKNDQLRAQLEKRASFDFQCPTESIELLALSNSAGARVDTADTARGMITSYGARGCGRQATYVLSPSELWIMNSSTP